MGKIKNLTERPKARTKRLKTEEDLAAARRTVAEGVQHKSLHLNAFEGRTLGAAGILVVSPTDMHEERRRLRAVLGHGQVIKEPVRNIGAIAAVSETKTIVWFVPRSLVGDVVGGRMTPLPGELKSVSLAACILGGCIADEEWLRACEGMYAVWGRCPSR